MKNYTITVNGNVYDVTVEENGAGAVQTAAPVVAPSRCRKYPGKSRCSRKSIPDSYIRWSECTGWRYCNRDRGHEDGDPGCCPGSRNYCQH